MAKIYDTKVIAVELTQEDFDNIPADDMRFCRDSGDYSLVLGSVLKKQGWRLTRILKSGHPYVVEVYAWS